MPAVIFPSPFIIRPSNPAVKSLLTTNKLFFRTFLQIKMSLTARARSRVRCGKMWAGNPSQRGWLFQKKLDCCSAKMGVLQGTGNRYEAFRASLMTHMCHGSDVAG